MKSPKAEDGVASSELTNKSGNDTSGPTETPSNSDNARGEPVHPEEVYPAYVSDTAMKSESNTLPSTWYGLSRAQ